MTIGPKNVKDLTEENQNLRIGYNPAVEALENELNDLKAKLQENPPRQRVRTLSDELNATEEVAVNGHNPEMGRLKVGDYFAVPLNPNDIMKTFQKTKSYRFVTETAGSRRIQYLADLFHQTANAETGDYCQDPINETRLCPLTNAMKENLNNIATSCKLLKSFKQKNPHFTYAKEMDSANVGHVFTFSDGSSWVVSYSVDKPNEPLKRVLTPCLTTRKIADRQVRSNNEFLHETGIETRFCKSQVEYFGDTYVDPREDEVYIKDGKGKGKGKGEKGAGKGTKGDREPRSSESKKRNRSHDRDASIAETLRQEMRQMLQDFTERSGANSQSSTVNPNTNVSYTGVNPNVNVGQVSTTTPSYSNASVPTQYQNTGYQNTSYSQQYYPTQNQYYQQTNLQQQYQQHVRNSVDRIVGEQRNGLYNHAIEVQNFEIVNTNRLSPYRAHIAQILNIDVNLILWEHILYIVNTCKP